MGRFSVTPEMNTRLQTTLFGPKAEEQKRYLK